VIGVRVFLYSVLCSVLFTTVLCPTADSEVRSGEYDVIVVGAGSGGTAAAIQAARCGASVALVDETGWIGGQITAAAVSTMDDVGHNRSGLYLEFIRRVRESYGATGTDVNICYWGNDTIATEPKVAEEIFLDMLRGSAPGKVELFLHRTPEAVLTEGNRVTGVILKDGDSGTIMLKGKVTIDATECGDLLPMTPARYRAGNSLSTNLDMDGEIQDITWVAVIKSEDSIPEELKVKRPDGYDRDVGRFRRVVTTDGATWPGQAPFDFASHKAYRALPDRGNPHRIEGGESETWPYITRTCVNWANDVPANGPDHVGLTVRYLEDKDYRRLVNGEAIGRTLRFIHYVQTELGLSNWTVDRSQGYGERWGRIRDRALYLDESNDAVLNHFPPIPYVRESRRIVGIETMTAKTVARDRRLGRAVKNRTNSIALGEYPLDIHGSRVPGSLESDLGESMADYPGEWRSDEGVFQVPYGALIPETVDGLLAAEKNISVSRLVNGATRLQPITILTGQAAGAIAALSSLSHRDPRNLPVISVQDVLLRGKSALSLYSFFDVQPDHPHWRGVQGATLYGYFDPMTPVIFGTSLPVEERHMSYMISRAFYVRDLEGGDLFVSRSDFVERLKKTAPRWEPSSMDWDGPPEELISRGEAVTAVWDALVQSVPLR